MRLILRSVVVAVLSLSVVSTITLPANAGSSPHPHQFSRATIRALNAIVDTSRQAGNFPGAIVGIWIPGRGSYVRGFGTGNIKNLSVSGIPVGRFITQNILRPLGLRHTSYPTGTAMPSPFSQGYLREPDGSFRDVTVSNPGIWGWGRSHDIYLI